MSAPLPLRSAEVPEDLRLTSDEIAELTERLLESSGSGRTDVGLPLEDWLAVFESRHVPAEAIRAAVDDLVRRRQQRLSNVLRIKSDELERMLLGLLPRLDASFHASVKVALPRPAAVAPEWVEYRIAAERGELEVRVRHLSGEGTRELFALLVREARPASRLRWLFGRRHARPRQVRVLEPHGLRLEDLLSWTSSRDRAGAGAAQGRIVGFAFERLREAVLGEVDRALGFVRDLRFEGAAGEGLGEAEAGCESGAGRG